MLHHYLVNGVDDENYTELEFKIKNIENLKKKNSIYKYNHQFELELNL